jgi:hypothetical protein
MRRALVIAALMAWSAPAAAHHVVSDSGIAWVEPVTVTEVSVEASTFDQGAFRRGRWQAVSASAQYAPLSWLSTSLRAPLAFVQYDDGRGALGVGDVEVGARLRLWESPHGGLIASAGLGVELPTGDASVGLGGGHVELSPYLIASAQPHPNLIFVGMTSARLSLGGAAHSGPPTAHGAVIAPHAPRELFTRASAAWVQERVWYGSLALDLAYMPGALARSPWVGRCEAGYLGVDGLRLSLSIDQTLAGDARHGLLGRISAAWMF